MSSWTRLDLLRPNCQPRVVSKPADQKIHHVVVIQQLGPVTYTVEVEGKLLKCHVDHLHQWIDSASPSAASVNVHTIRDNFTYSESYPDAPQESRGEDEVLEDLSHR